MGISTQSDQGLIFTKSLPWVSRKFSLVNILCEMHFFLFAIKKVTLNLMLGLSMTYSDIGFTGKKCIAQQIEVKHVNRNGLHNLSLPVNANATEAEKKHRLLPVIITLIDIR